MARPRRARRLLRPTAARLAVLCYFVGVALLAWLLPAQPLVAWKSGADTHLLGFLPDGQTLLTATRLTPPDRCRGPVCFWDIRSGRQVDSLLTDEDRLLPNIAITPDGAVFAWRDLEHVHVLDFATRQEMARLPAGPPVPAPFYGCLAFSPDGGSLVYDLVSDAPARTALAVWDVAARRERFRLEGEGGPVAFAPDGRLLATCTPAAVVTRTGGEPRGGAKLWDAATGQRVATLANPDRSRYAVEARFAPEGDTLAVLCWPRAQGTPNLELWDIASARLLATIDGASTGFFLPEGCVLVTFELDERRVASLRYWDGSNGQPLRRAAIVDTSAYRSWYGLRVSADRRWVVVRGQRDVVQDAIRFRLARVPRWGWLSPGDPRTTGQVLVYDTASGRLRADVRARVFEGAIPSPDGEHLVTVGAGEIKVWGVPPARPWGRALTWPVLPALAVWLAGCWLSRRKQRASTSPVQ